MSYMSPETREQITTAYKRMADQANLRLMAPGDGFGNISGRVEDLDLEQEAAAYVDRWWAQEDAGDFHIGCANFPTREAMIYSIEAARLFAGTSAGIPHAVKLLEMAQASAAKAAEEDPLRS